MGTWYFDRWLFSNKRPVNVLVKSQLTTTGALQTVATTITEDDTIPTSSEGTELTGLTAAYTPSNVGNKLRVTVKLMYSGTGIGNGASALFKDSGADALAVSGFGIKGANLMANLTYKYEETVTSLDPVTFKVRLGHSAGSTLYLNGIAGNRVYGGRATSSILVEEFQA